MNGLCPRGKHIHETKSKLKYTVSAKEEKTNMMTYLDGDGAVGEGWNEEEPIR